MSSVVRKEKETEETVEDIGCAMSMINNFSSQVWWCGGKLRSYFALLFYCSTP